MRSFFGGIGRNETDIDILSTEIIPTKQKLGGFLFSYTIEMQVIEYGHYYQKQGPTQGTQDSITLFNKLKELGRFSSDIFTVLFIDDVHDCNPFEPVSSDHLIDFDAIGFNKTICESRTKIAALQIIDTMQGNNYFDILTNHNKKLRKKDGKTTIELIDKKIPSCVMMDVALTEMKSKYGSHIVNILPACYKKQQENLHHMVYALFHTGIIKKPIYLESILFSPTLTHYEHLQTLLQPAKACTISF